MSFLIMNENIACSTRAVVVVCATVLRNEFLIPWVGHHIRK